ncbi:hypothetical protein Q2T41_13640 [Maribacter confluentis]|uniref:YD repeat-containing protein n=1 Tax=Maribacter confluentis TaxID=1656093 RepID=A0ABT8RS07_9FLAO|nr:hypothetical protein [Maribacter confluentis]MDO1513701.1 hypothetical protein [Maribacter confluentis]
MKFQAGSPLKHFLVFILLSINYGFGQIKIGENPENLHSTSLLELESISRVFVINRMDNDQMRSLKPLEGAVVYNTDEKCLHYYDGSKWNNICAYVENTGLSIIDNGDGSFTVNNGNEALLTFNGADETISTLVLNSDDTFTYTNEAGERSVIDLKTSHSPILTSLIDNNNGTLTYFDELNNQTIIDLKNPQSTIASTLINNNNSTYTYTDELGNETIIDVGSMLPDVVSTLVDNGDGTYTYTDEENNETIINVENGISSQVSTLVDNRDGTYTYRDEQGNLTTFFIGNSNGRHFGESGSIFFANETTGDPSEDNENLFWDNVNKRLGIGISSPRNTLHVNGILRTNRTNSGGGTEAFPGYHFSPAFNTGLFWPQNDGIGFSVAGREIMRISNNTRVGINVQAPQATLHVGGDLIVDGTITTSRGTYKSPDKSNEIRVLDKVKEAITLSDKTLIIKSTVKQMVLPTAWIDNRGHIFIFKNLNDISIPINLNYIDNKGDNSNEFPNNSVIWLQSDGSDWQQIN